MLPPWDENHPETALGLYARWAPIELVIEVDQRVGLVKVHQVNARVSEVLFPPVRRDFIAS
jgi:hypothetical protein